jgi:hypothetical protein
MADYKAYGTYADVCEKYPDIVYVEGENLNLFDNKLRMIQSALDDKNRFKNITDIAAKLDISERCIHRLINENNLKRRIKCK